MKLRIVISWVPVALAGSVLLLFAVHLTQAFIYFGHIPQYLIDTDPFHSQNLFLPDIGIPVYLLAIPGLLLWPVALFLPWTRYCGSHPVRFYSAVLLTAILLILLLWIDVTGFISWYLD